MKLFARLGIAAFLAVCVMMWAGCSWADDGGGEEPSEEAGAISHAWVNLIHHTDVELDSVEPHEPQYDSTELQELVVDFGLDGNGTITEETNSGKIAITPKANLVVQYYNYLYNFVRSQDYSVNQPVSFDLYLYTNEDGGGWPRGYSLASADATEVSERQQALFRDEGVGEALSEAPFTFEFTDDISGSGVLPKIKTSADYTTDGSVPYMQPVLNSDGKVSKLEYGFVNPATKEFATTSTTITPVIRIREINIFLTDRNSLHSTINTDGEDWQSDEKGSGPYNGKKQELLLTKITPIDLKKIGSLRIGFDYPRVTSGGGDSEDSEGGGGGGEEGEGDIDVTSTVFYYWNFNNVSADWENENQEPAIILEV
jgi:hypothetical protein